MFPPDIWQFEIGPYLDYNSRIELSRLLPPEYRLKPRKFTKEEIISHSSSSVYETLRTRIQKVQYSRRGRLGKICEMWLLKTYSLLGHMVIFENYSNFEIRMKV